MIELNFHSNNDAARNPPPSTRLPILQHLTKVYKMWQDSVQHFPKKSRHTLGAKIDTCFVETLEYIFLASITARDKKLPFLERGSAKFDVLKFFLQLAWEIKALDTDKYALLMDPLNDVGKMIGGWQKNILSQTQTPSPKKGSGF